MAEILDFKGKESTYAKKLVTRPPTLANVKSWIEKAKTPPEK